MLCMGWRTTDDVSEFLEAAGGFLRAERARNTVILTVTEQLRLNASPYPAAPAAGPLLGWWSDPAGPGESGTASGAFLHTPPFPIVLTDVPAGVAEDLAAVLAGSARPLGGVNADPAVARAFADAWRAATGCLAEVHREQRLYRLAELAWPDPAPAGAARIATEADVDLLADWFAAFAREANDMAGDADQAAAVRERLGYGGLMVWDLDGEAVSLAGNTRQVAGMVRVGPVYTPPELRGHGYASAVTAAISGQALAAGAEEVLLYTDLANRVANSIYQRIGYRPVEDRVVLAFSEAGQAG
jgi:GNAT superfamily N-acetyltransferase